ncbi:MAG: T9SS type A sorting domain-containing protein [Flavobacteriales bacterium]|nr:T9SS type A sorting domain-containing protein [Flavobacteriales bacterium]
MEMKRTLLSAALLTAGIAANAQVIMDVQEPPGLQGNYTVTWAGTDWGIDITDPIYAVTDTLAIVDDGTASDSLGCNALINGAEIAGKIAVVYRGTCEFGTKALNAQNAGAVGVIIVNNQGAPIVPGAGADGSSVTIPVVMISTDDGALLHDEIVAGNVVAFIGSIQGLYGDDIGFFKNNVIVPSYTAIPNDVAQNGSEFNFPLGLWLFNYGTNDQVGATVSAVVRQGGSTLLTMTSDPTDILAGDSVFVDLGTMSLSSYGGNYDLTYSCMLNGVLDEYLSNDSLELGFSVGSVIAYTPIDENSGIPTASGGAIPTGNTEGFTLCNYFNDANASRLGVTGMYFSLSSVTSGDDLTGTLVEIECFEITDAFTGLSDFPADPVLDPLHTAEYTFTSDAQNTQVFAPFDEAFQLDDNTPYLFCVTTFDANNRIGYNELLNYTLYQDNTDRLVTTVQDPTGFYEGGFVGGGAGSMAVQTIPASTIGIAENTSDQEVVPYPNPTTRLVHIPLSGRNGKATLSVSDLSGRVVKDVEVTLNNELVMDMDGLSNGTYLFRLAQDGRSTSFRVVVSK